MQKFEGLGVFYLGRETGGAEGEDRPLVLYDSKDLLTHAVCVGMTGSGKTGLCIGLLEEAALDAIPSIVIDPKGDLANLLLTFPDLEPEDFLPWINADDARKKELSPAQYADRQAALWRRGLAEWGQDGQRIRQLREAAEFVIYTPGNSAGVPVSILRSFDAPARAILEDPDLLRERISTTVTSLLDLLGLDTDPLQSREHILLSSILETAWQQGLNLDIPQLIREVQAPPFPRIGVFDLEAFFPADDRHELAMKLNNFLAAPTMKAWTEGEPIDLNRMLYGPRGKPRVAIFSIAHLGDAERMFFVSLLLLQVVGWMRSQSGTNSLRALLYMDEIFGYLPPVANPPSKGPLLTLLKQARAFGLGIVLATQNPVDLDYKALSNTGTWFIGRLQTERDQARVLDGLQGTQAGEGTRFDRRQMGQILAGLGSRKFLMNNVHEQRPVLFETRWVMSYLRGPLTRDQIRRLMEPFKSLAAETAAAPEQAAQASGPGAAAAQPPGAAAVPPPGAAASTRPVIDPGISQFFIPPRAAAEDARSLVYEPVCLAMAKIYYLNAKADLSAEREVSYLARISPKLDRPLWEEAAVTEIRDRDLETVPEPGAEFAAIPSALGEAKNYTSWSKDFRDWLYHSQILKLYHSPSLNVFSEPGESEKDFRIRLQQTGHERRDELIEKIRRRYAARISSLQDRIRRAEQAVDREKEQARQQKLQTAISVGVTVLDALVGRKTVGRTTLGRATTAARGAGRILKEKQDVDRAEENVEAMTRQLAEIEAKVAQETESLRTAVDPLAEDLETLEIRPKKTDISVRVLALGWVPYRRGGQHGALY
ncbi:MAG: hypothetical protein JXB06_09415 [Spirochaetales bacterium]|nr:hypothetical protein [Spirochaetales bacterium]